MILAVDCGNSAVKLALAEGAELSRVQRLPTRSAGEADLEVAVRELLEKAPERPEAIVAVSVVDRWSDRLERLGGILGLPLTVVAASSVPIATALVRRDQTGPDRLLGAWAAWRLHGGPIVVVGLGTATTVDAVDGDGIFLGGAIMPGPALAARSLAEATDRLPRIELELPAEPIGTDTLSALRSGIVLGHVGAIRELVTRMRPGLEGAGRRSGPPAARQVRVLVSGGQASAAWMRSALLEPAGPDLPAVADLVEADLVLRGLGLLAAQRMVTAGPPT